MPMPTSPDMQTEPGEIALSLQAVSALGLMQARVLLTQLKAGHWSEQIRSLVSPVGKPAAVDGYVLHPCLIGQQPTLIHAPDLEGRDPGFYQQLQHVAQRHGYVLMADRRSQDVPVAGDRRRRWLPVLVLSLGVGQAMAQEPVAEQTLGLFETHAGHSHQLQTDAELDNALPVEVDAPSLMTGEPEELNAILQAHFQVEDGDPEYVREDLQAMAAYFADFPEAVSLLKSLQGHAWQLRYSKDTFETQVRGSQIQVKAATINFDSRAAAQLKKHKACVGERRGACIASPADALLHELLHVESALLDSETFIAQGGLNSVVYPYAHEHAVIARENKLYRAMSAVDGGFRPSRRHHSGSLVASSCVTCLN